jgi:twitching motility protein PilT
MNMPDPGGGTTADFPEQLRQWLAAAVAQEASDLHLVPNHPPVVRVHGLLIPLDDQDVSAARLADLLMAICSPRNRQQFAADKNVDFSLQVEVEGAPRRFRANYFLSGGQLGACFRVIPAEIPDFSWAGFPWEVADRLAHFRNGLVLVSGVAGSGKTTTLAMIINLLNQEGGNRIITVEEPVEYVFPRLPGSVVTQREVGEDVTSFADGLKYGLRQDPDIILVDGAQRRGNGAPGVCHAAHA